MARYSRASQDILSCQSMQYWDAVGAQLRQRDVQCAQATCRAEQQSKLEEERAAMSKSIRIGNRDYTWNDLRNESVRRELLPELERMIASYKADPKPWQAAGWTDQDLHFAIKYTTGMFDNFSEEQMGKTVLGSAYQSATTQLSGRELAKEVSKLADSQDYKVGEERRRSKQEQTRRSRLRIIPHLRPHLSSTMRGLRRGQFAEFDISPRRVGLISLVRRRQRWFFRPLLCAGECFKRSRHLIIRTTRRISRPCMR